MLCLRFCETSKAWRLVLLFPLLFAVDSSEAFGQGRTSSRWRPYGRGTYFGQTRTDREMEAAPGTTQQILSRSWQTGDGTATYRERTWRPPVEARPLQTFGASRMTTGVPGQPSQQGTLPNSPSWQAPRQAYTRDGGAVTTTPHSNASPSNTTDARGNTITGQERFASRNPTLLRNPWVQNLTRSEATARYGQTRSPDSSQTSNVTSDARTRYPSTHSRANSPRLVRNEASHALRQRRASPAASSKPLLYRNPWVGGDSSAIRRLPTPPTLDPVASAPTPPSSYGKTRGTIPPVPSTNRPSPGLPVGVIRR